MHFHYDDIETLYRCPNCHAQLDAPGEDCDDCGRSSTPAVDVDPEGANPDPVPTPTRSDFDALLEGAIAGAILCLAILLGANAPAWVENGWGL